MKVLCINDNWKIHHSVTCGHPIFGETYTVIDEGLDAWRQNCYELAEFPGIWANQKHFAPISEIDETEFERNYNLEKV